MRRILAVLFGALLACATALTVLAGPAVAQPAASAPDSDQAVAEVVAGDASPDAATEQKPTVRELLQACKTKTDVCQFHPSGPPHYFLSPPTLAGDTVFACGSEADKPISWSRSVSSTNTVGVAITASAGFQEVFEVSVQVSYSYSWEVTHTFTNGVTVHVPPYHKGFVELATPRARVTGQYELHFGNKFYGHYIWYVNNYTETGPRKGAPGQDTAKTPAMTAQERKVHCG